MAKGLQVEFLTAGLSNSEGLPLSGGKVYVYEAGTTTPTSLYTDSELTVQAPNPIILDGWGRARVYGSGTYRFSIYNADDVLQFTLENASYQIVVNQSLYWGGSATHTVTDAYVITTSSPFSSYFEGMRIAFIADHENTGPATVAANGLAAKTILKDGAALSAADIPDGSVVDVVYDPAGNFRLAYATVAITTSIADGQITTAKIDDLAVTEAKIAADAVATAKIKNLNVTEAKIGAGAVTTAKIADLNVTGAKIANGAIINEKIANDAISERTIANGAISERTIATGAVTTGKIGAGAILEGNIGGLAVTEGKIGAGAVTNSKIATNAVTEDKIGAGAVTTAKIHNGTITSDKLAGTYQYANSAALGIASEPSSRISAHNINVYYEPITQHLIYLLVHGTFTLSNNIRFLLLTLPSTAILGSFVDGVSLAGTIYFGANTYNTYPIVARYEVGSQRFVIHNKNVPQRGTTDNGEIPNLGGPWTLSISGCVLVV